MRRTHKKCSSCGLLKPIKWFYRDNSKKTKCWTSKCHTCGVAYYRKLRSGKAIISFQQAIGRCNNPNNKDYKHYGGRGIRFKFQSWHDLVGCIGERPPGTSLDRVDTNGHYEPGNVRWATPKQQAVNRRNTLLSQEDADKIRYYRKTGFNVRQIEAIFGIGKSQISKIINNKSWTTNE